MATQRTPARSRTRVNEPRRSGEPDAGATRGAKDDATEDIRAGFWRWGRIAFVLASLFIVVQLLHMVQSYVDAVFRILLYIIFGGLLALMVAPIDRRLRQLVPPPLAAITSLLVAVACVAGAGYLISAPIVGQARELTRSLPRLEQPFLSLQQFFADHGVNVSVSSMVASLGLQTSGSQIGTVVLHAVSFTVQLALDLVITLVTTFWLLNDRASLRRRLLAILPGGWRTNTEFGLDAFVVVFGGFIRAQLMLAVLVGALAGAGCFLLGVPFPLLIGFAAAVFELIPLAGPFVGAAVGILFALTVSPTLALETLGLFALIHVIEGYLVAPRIQARFVRLHPLVTLLALLIGVYAGGFLGAFFAVPLASFAAVLLRAVIADKRAEEPDFFLVDEEDRAARGRRRRLLAEYQVSPAAVLRRLTKRLAGRSGA